MAGQTHTHTHTQRMCWGKTPTGRCSAWEKKKKKEGEREREEDGRRENCEVREREGGRERRRVEKKILNMSGKECGDNKEMW